MELALRLLEPTFCGNTLFMMNRRRRLMLRLQTGECHDHDRDREDSEERDQAEERHGREQEPRRLGLGTIASLAIPPESPLARHRSEIVLGTSPFAFRRLRHPLALHHSKVSAFSYLLNNLRRQPGAYFLRGTVSVARVSSPHFTTTVSIPSLFGIVSLTSHQSSTAAKPVSFWAMVGATSAVEPLTVAGRSVAL